MQSKLGVGTVQFGLAYGVSNTAGRTSPQEAREILRIAAEKALTLIDTAPAYGSSEAVIGDALPPGHGFRFVTKTPEISSTRIGPEECALVERTFRKSLESLGLHCAYGLLVHDADDLLKAGAERLLDTLRNLRKQGLVTKIGVSVYDEKQIDSILGRFDLDLVQLPVSIVDQRLLVSGHLARMATRNIEIHARSAFLQGLLLMGKGAWPERFRHAFGLLERFHEIAGKRGLTPVQLALGFVQSIPQVSQVVCGVNNVAQLRELIDAAAIALQVGEFVELRSDSEALVDPRCWARSGV